ncbi:hypothetical protein [Nonomuraea sp. NPDC049028]|uniref:hypothetical protein n=1 Tax=Nonomuraea sp. NPDC049028 TaxID=3364348 RepID=UPI00371E8AA0
MRGALNELAAKPSGPSARKSEAEKENERLRARAEKAERKLAKDQGRAGHHGKVPDVTPVTLCLR